MRVLRIDDHSPYNRLVGIGGIGTGIFFALEGDHTLGRNESRAGRLLDVRDYCKLHIVIHYVAKLLGAHPSGAPFHVLPVGKVGDDSGGRFLREEMIAAGIDTSLVTRIPGHPTLFSVCFQYPDHSGGNITTSTSAAGTLCRCDVDEVADVLRSGGARTMASLLPEVSMGVRRYFLELATRSGNFRTASFVAGEIAQAKNEGMFDQLDLVCLNEDEAPKLIGENFSSDGPERLAEKSVRLLHRCYPNLKMVISAGKNGAYAVSCESWNYCPAPKVQVASSAGAGDCLMGGILAGLAAGIPLMKLQGQRSIIAKGPLETALELSVLLASYKVTSPHTIHPDATLSTLIDFADAQGLSLAPEIQDRVTDEPAIRV